MPDPTPLLRHQDVVRALDGLDVLDVVSRELIQRHHGVELVHTGGTDVAVSTEVTTVEEHGGGRACVLPTQSLHMIGLAALTVLAARVLLSPSAVTATILGEGPAAHLHLAMLARYTPQLAGAAMHPAAPNQDASLLIIAESGWDAPVVEPLRPGALIINASRRDLPDRVLADVDRLYVDDLGLLEHNQHRTFVQWHLAGADHRPPARDGRPAPWRDQRRIEHDLGHLLSGGSAEPVTDDVVLVELIDGGSLLARLAADLYQAAIALGVHPADP
jgi:hypothetical protein